MAKVKKVSGKSNGDKFFKSKNSALLFDKSNYLLVVIGALFIIVGFILMAGGGSNDPSVFNADEIYSARRITVAPIIVVIGFIIEAYAILKKTAHA